MVLIGRNGRRNCAIPGCSSPKSIAYFPFPKDGTLRAQKWMAACGFAQTRASGHNKRAASKSGGVPFHMKRALVCEMHFHPRTSYTVVADSNLSRHLPFLPERRVLNKWAVPTLHLSKDDAAQAEVVIRTMMKRKDPAYCALTNRVCDIPGCGRWKLSLFTKHPKCSPAVARTWEDICRLQEEHAAKGRLRVCQVHFTQQDFDMSDDPLSNDLLPTAFPKEYIPVIEGEMNLFSFTPAVLLEDCRPLMLPEGEPCEGFTNPARATLHHLEEDDQDDLYPGLETKACQANFDEVVNFALADAMERLEKSIREKQEKLLQLCQEISQLEIRNDESEMIVITPIVTKSAGGIDKGKEENEEVEMGEPEGALGDGDPNPLKHESLLLEEGVVDLVSEETSKWASERFKISYCSPDEAAQEHLELMDIETITSASLQEELENENVRVAHISESDNSGDSSDEVEVSPSAKPTSSYHPSNNLKVIARLSSVETQADASKVSKIVQSKRPGKAPLDRNNRQIVFKRRPVIVYEPILQKDVKELLRKDRSSGSEAEDVLLLKGDDQVLIKRTLLKAAANKNQAALKLLQTRQDLLDDPAYQLKQKSLDNNEELKEKAIKKFFGV